MLLPIPIYRPVSFQFLIDVTFASVRVTGGGGGGGGVATQKNQSLPYFSDSWARFFFVFFLGYF